MLKKSLIAIAVLAIAMPAVAGQLKIHGNWPCSYDYQDVAVIDVLVEVGYYVHVVNQDPITLIQKQDATDPFHTYEGCTTTAIQNNFIIDLKATIANTATDLGGTYVIESIDSVPAAVNNGGVWSIDGMAMGSQDVKICVLGTDVDITQVPGGTTTTNPVAQITISVVPGGEGSLCCGGISPQWQTQAQN
jgi:hypothetical protein